MRWLVRSVARRGLSTEVQYLRAEGCAPVVKLEYDDLVKGRNLAASIEVAFGYNGLGLLVVQSVPGVKERRDRLLHLAHKFAALPDNVKNKYVHKQSAYNFGWSRGVELLDGVPDMSKGSYYGNPQYDDPYAGDAEMLRKCPSIAHPNIWPKAELPDLEFAFKEAGQLVVKIGEMVAAQCDGYVSSVRPGYQPGRLAQIIRNSKTCKGRLLNYFPPEPGHEGVAATGPLTEGDFGSWCGWHNDNGSLTGLIPAMYIDPNDREVANPDRASGLYVRSRSGGVVKAAVPPDALAFQIGEAAQIHTGGALQATPHAVRAAQGPSALGISRCTFAVFMQPNLEEAMSPPPNVPVDVVLAGAIAGHLPRGVPPIGRRWAIGDDFGAFCKKTIDAYLVDDGAPPKK